MQCPNCGAVFNYQVDICPNCTYAMIQPPPPYQQMQPAQVQPAYQQQAQAQRVPLQPVAGATQEVKASEVAASAAKLASQGIRGLKSTVAGRASIQWIALGAVALMLVCSLGPWFVTSSKYAAAASLADGALQLLGMGSIGSYSLASVYYGFQLPMLASAISSSSIFVDAGNVAIAIWFFFALWIVGFIVTVIGVIVTLKSKRVKRVLLIIGAAFMAASAGLWTVAYSVDMVGNGVASGTPAPILCLISAIASIVLVVIAGSKNRNRNEERNAS